MEIPEKGCVVTTPIQEHVVSHPRVTVGFDPFTYRSLDSLASTVQLSTSEIVRRAIEELLISSSRRPGTEFLDDHIAMRTELGADNEYQRLKREALSQTVSNPEEGAKKPGPAKRYGHRLSISMSAQIFDGLDTYCADKRVGLAAAIRTAVDLFLSKHIYKKELGHLVWDASSPLDTLA